MKKNLLIFIFLSFSMARSENLFTCLFVPGSAFIDGCQGISKSILLTTLAIAVRVGIYKIIANTSGEVAYFFPESRIRVNYTKYALGALLALDGAISSCELLERFVNNEAEAIGTFIR